MMRRINNYGRLPQLAVFGTAAVDRGSEAILFICFGLAPNAQAHAGHGFAARLGYFGIAFLATCEALARRDLATRMLDRVLDRCIDLLLYGAIFCKTTCHGDLFYTFTGTGLVARQTLVAVDCIYDETTI